MVVKFWIKAITMPISHLMTMLIICIPHFDLNSQVFVLHHIMEMIMPEIPSFYFELVKSQGSSDSFSNIM